ncbi:MAG TPA: hypothetical protein VL967_07845 [Terracidiphilus sp.]|nr:hypothetical protein [Terracidiphilus sp.]
MGFEFGRAAFIGLCIGLIWGVGCALVLLYSIYLAGYRKAVKDSLAPEGSKRFKQTLESLKARRVERAPGH